MAPGHPHTNTLASPQSQVALGDAFPSFLADFRASQGSLRSIHIFPLLLNLIISLSLFSLWCFLEGPSELKQELEYYDEEEFDKNFELEFERELEREFGSKKRKAASGGGQEERGESEDEEDGTVAEKRRRNTAASAKFRLKKKMKEQRLEAMAKLMTDRANVMQKRVDELEAEVGYLRDMVTLRRDQRVSDFIQL